MTYQNPYPDTYQRLYKIVIVGDSGVGKSTVIADYMGTIEPQKETIGVEFATRIISEENMKIKMQLWDTAGKERFRTVIMSYYRGAHGFIIMYDANNRESFNNVEKWYSGIRSINAIAFIIVVANKVDLLRRVSELEGANITESLTGTKGNFFEMSVRNKLLGDSAECIFYDLCSKINQKVNNGTILCDKIIGLQRNKQMPIVRPRKYYKLDQCCCLIL